MTLSERNLKDNSKRNKFKNNKNKEGRLKISKRHFSLLSPNQETYKNPISNLKKLLPVKRISLCLIKIILYQNLNKLMSRKIIKTYPLCLDQAKSI